MKLDLGTQAIHGPGYRIIHLLFEVVGANTRTHVLTQMYDSLYLNLWQSTRRPGPSLYLALNIVAAEGRKGHHDA